MNSKNVILIVGLVLGGLLVAGIITTLVVNRKRDNDDSEASNCRPCAPAQPCQPCQPCPPCPTEGSYNHCQTITNDTQGADNTFGNSLAVSGDFMVATSTFSNIEGVMQSRIFVYVSEEAVGGCYNYSMKYSIVQDGKDPIVTMSGNQLYVATTTLDDKGMMFQYKCDINTYEIQYTSVFNSSPEAIDSYNDNVVVMSEGIVYLYNNGVINHTFVNRNAKSVAISGNTNYVYILIGSSAYAYLFCAQGSNPCQWGEPAKVFMDTSSSFGEEVAMSLPLLVISSVDKGYIYDLNQDINKPQTCVVLDQTKSTVPSISGSDVLFTVPGKTEVYSSNNCNGWYESYVFNFPGSSMSVAEGECKRVLISNVEQSNSAIDTYIKVYP